MKINHIAIWTSQLDTMKNFYNKYFGTTSNQKYINKAKGFSSYFLVFDDGCRIELMQKENIEPINNTMNTLGLAHFAISVGGKESSRPYNGTDYE